jgi:RNA polymerase sigma factor (sigma-70 family)
VTSLRPAGQVHHPNRDRQRARSRHNQSLSSNKQSVDGRFDRLSDARLLELTPRNPDAFGELYARTEDAVLLFFLRRGASADLAADLAGETFAAALISAPKFRNEGAGALAWLYGIARNVLALSRRRGEVESRARKRLAMEPIELTDEALEAIDQLGSDEALTALAELPAEQRTAITAHVIHDRSYPAIASAMKCSEMVLRQRVSRGLRTLRTQMENSP